MDPKSKIAFVDIPIDFVKELLYDEKNHTNRWFDNDKPDNFINSLAINNETNTVKYINIHNRLNKMPRVGKQSSPYTRLPFIQDQLRKKAKEILKNDPSTS